MIRVRRNAGAPIEDIELAEFERRARTGEIAPQHEVCFPAVTGAQFVRARELELFRGLYAAGPITFRRYFNLRRMPWLTLGCIGLLVATYFGWEGGRPASINDLTRLGAKNTTLMLEQGQWWRLLTANLLHVSGWHLGVNAVFLLNLGGPTEAIFRRLDYVLVLVAAALGTTLMSALANPAVSCGASGVVFGVWGAAAVFGVRHRDILPDRYRRYFIGSVIPYSIFALYLGFATPGIDNWGHLGGLLAGCSVAFFLPARLLHPRDPAAGAKVLVLAVVALGIAGASFLRRGGGPLSTACYFPKNGLEVPVPIDWAEVLHHTGDGNETYAFKNGAGVVVGIETHRDSAPVQPSRLVRDFVDHTLAGQVDNATITGLRLAPAEPMRLAGLPGKELRADMLVHHTPTRIDFLLAARGSYRYLVSLSTPSWLAGRYADTFARIRRGIRLTTPEALQNARRRVHDADSPGHEAALAVARAQAGQLDAALHGLEQAAQRWPGADVLSRTKSRLQRDFAPPQPATPGTPGTPGTTAPPAAPSHTPPAAQTSPRSSTPPHPQPPAVTPPGAAP